MKKIALSISIVILSFSMQKTLAQEESSCDVLKTEISEKYQGECKRGRAHGKGIAKGIDEYEGEFKKGLPHGYGTYKWANGDIYKGEFKNGFMHGNGIFTWANGDTFEGKFLFNVKNGIGKLTYNNGEILAGNWYKDEYAGEQSADVNAYKISNKRNIKNIRVSKIPSAGPNKIEIVFKRGGRTYREMDNLRLIGNSGTVITSSTFTAFESVIFPFEGKVSFNAPNETYVTTFNCEFNIQINETGSWLIEITF
jgi:hypothetical protein